MSVVPVFGQHAFGGTDTQVPTARCVELLNHEIEENDKPWEIHLLPEADHDLVEYRELDGKKVLSRFAEGFLLAEALWLKQIFDLSKTAPTPGLHGSTPN